VTDNPRNNQAALTTGSVGWKLFSMAGPMVIGFLAMMFYNIADRYFVSKLGTDALAAMQYITPVVMTIFAITFGLAAGVSAVVAKAIGEGDMQRVRQLTLHSLILSLSLVGVFMLVGLLTMDSLFRAMGASGDVLQLVKEYMRIWYVGMFFLVVPVVGNTIIRATGNAVIPAIIMLVGVGLNLLFDPLLIFGRWGLPEMGIVGAAVASVIGRSVSMTLSLLILRYRVRLLAWSTVHIKALWRSWRMLLFVGIPSSGTKLLMAMAMGILTWWVKREFGEEAVAALSAGFPIVQVPVMVFWSLAASVIPFIGQNFGAGKWDRVRRGLRVGQTFTVIWGFGSYLVLLALAPVIARQFSDEPAVVANSTLLLRIMPLGMATQGLLMLTTGTLNALHRPLSSWVLNVVRFVLLLTLVAGGTELFGMKGLFWGIVAADGVMGIYAGIWIWRVIAKDIRRHGETIPPSLPDAIAD
jgi:putative MATE family efflux protein